MPTGDEGRANERRARGEAWRIQSETSSEAPEELRRLVHQLRVHQVELDLQNQELIRLNHEAEAAKRLYSDLYDFAPVGYFTLDGAGTILRCNHRGAALLGAPRALVEGCCFAHSFGMSSRERLVALMEQARGSGGATCPLELVLPGGGVRHVQVEVSWLVEDDHYRVAVMDTEERWAAEEARRELVEQLQAALKKVEILSGMLPMCAWCKKIQDGRGHWRRMEDYLALYTGAMVTHGMCPDCRREIFPGPSTGE